MERVGFVGLGAVGLTLAQAYAEHTDAELIGFDVRHAGGTRLDAVPRLAIAHDVADVAGCQVIFSAVVPDAAITVARLVVAAASGPGLYADLNSCDPAAKRSAASLFDGAPLRYADCALAGGGVTVDGHRAPIIASGPGAEPLSVAGRRAQLEIQPVSDRVGDAATVKMLRSMITKTLEASVAEMLGAASQSHLGEVALRSFVTTIDRLGAGRFIDMQLDTLRSHATRRSTEMGMVARFAREQGVEPLMAEAAARRLRGLGEAFAAGDSDVASAVRGDPATVSGGRDD